MQLMLYKIHTEGTSLAFRLVGWLLRLSNRWLLCSVLLAPLIFFIFFHWLFSPYIALFFLPVSCFLALCSFSLLATPIGTHAPSSHSNASSSENDGLPKIPKTAAQAHGTMSDEEFEKFSAALVIAMGEGHRFHSHSGGAGDHGVDTTLHNIFSNRIIVQSKRYAHDNPVTPTQIRDFWGALSIHNAVYGFFVTTSTLTYQSSQTVRWSQGRIRCIDAWKIDTLLKYRYREVALAYRDVLEALGEIEKKTA